MSTPITSTITWHAVEEELPDADSLVIIADADGDVCLGFLDGDVWRYPHAERCIDPVTHWADVPAHPTLS